MSDKTDPRLKVLWSDQWRDDGMNNDLRLRFLTALDTADRAAGVVRVDTRDEALVERIARDKTVRRLVSEAESGGMGWHERSTATVRAVLAALREES